jgi:hypothetical protein
VNLVLLCNLDGRLDRLRAATDKDDLGQTLGRKLGKLVGKLHGRRGHVVHGARVVHRLQLLGDRVSDLCVSVAEGVRPRMRTHHVQVFPAAGVGHPDAIALDPHAHAFFGDVVSRREREDAVFQCGCHKSLGIQVGAGRGHENSLFI